MRGLERAERFNTEIDEAVGRLGYTHSAFADIGLNHRGLNIRKMVFIPSVVFYVVDREAQKIHVLRVLRHERDWQTVLYTFE